MFEAVPHLNPELAEFHSLPSQLALGIPHLCHTHLVCMWVLGTEALVLTLYPVSRLPQPLPLLFEAGGGGNSFLVERQSPSLRLLWLWSI